MDGLIHIYTGDGKGKTTASLGLSMRFAGNGGKVLYTQFLKNDNSSELNILNEIKNITFLPSGKYFGFTWSMDAKTKKDAKDHYTKYFNKIADMISTEDFGLLILDEIIAADNAKLIPHDTLMNFLLHKPRHLEVVLTGRNPANDLLNTADYISDIMKIRHPFDKNTAARNGIEK